MSAFHRLAALLMAAASVFYAGCGEQRQEAPVIVQEQEQQKSAPAMPEPPKGPAPTPQPAEFIASPEYDKYLLSGYTETYIQPDAGAYRAAVDAIDAFLPECKVAKFGLEDEDAAALGRALAQKPEYSFLRGVSLSEDGSVLRFTYSGDEESAMACVEKYRAAVKTLLNGLEGCKNQLEQVLYAYWSITGSTSGSLGSGSAFDVLVNHKGSSAGFAFALAGIFDQLGIENHIANAADGTHVWNIVNISGSYYQLDAAMDSGRTDGMDLFSFGMTDFRRQMSGGYLSWYCGHSAFYQYAAPECTDARFDFLMYSTGAELDAEGHALYFTDLSTGKRRRFDTSSGILTSVADTAKGMVGGAETA